MAGLTSPIEAALNERQAWLELVRDRRPQLRHFLRWAKAREDGGPEATLRLEHRRDVAWCRAVLHLFFEPWWGVAVYSCFDSDIGSTAAATLFREALPRAEAQEAIKRVYFPPRSVQHHRAQATLARAKRALVSICDQAHELERVICDPRMTFDERFGQLGNLDIDGWGRTTNFDCLIRAGVLKVGTAAYRPHKAYLADSTGPKKGFAKVWGIEPGRANVDTCENLLRLWTRDWPAVAAAVDVRWVGKPYDSADLENALCVFQERHHKDLPNPALFAEN